MQTQAQVIPVTSQHSTTIADQPQNNTTLWIGHLPADPADHYGGQTFSCARSGQLQQIELFASAVHSPGDLRLTVHEFDDATQTWGGSIGETSLLVKKEDGGSWVQFPISDVRLSAERTYGFKLSASHAMVGLGEAVSGVHSPFSGFEWQADSNEKVGKYFSYFSLAFKVAVE